MQVTVTSLNIGQLARLPGGKAKTGIFKAPQAGPVEVTPLGLADDHIGDARHHGGHDQAVYLYSAADYAWWSAQLGRPCEPGLFGENITIDQWWPDPRIGDRIQWGEVVLELTAPRIPCNTLAARLADPQFVKRFTAAARPGAYARVLTPGSLTTGQTGEVTPAATTFATVNDVFHLWKQSPPDRVLLEAALRAPLASRARIKFAGAS